MTIEWKIDISHIQGGYIEQAKVEAERQIAEQLKQLTETMDTGFGLIIDELRATNILFSERQIQKNLGEK